MKKFISKISLFIFIFICYKAAISLALYFSISAHSSINFIGQNIEGKNRIVIVGSSNISHNYDYKLLNENYKDYNVILCSLSEPNGFFANIYSLKKLNLTEKDIVIFSFPHTFYEKAKFMPFNKIISSRLSQELINDAVLYAPNETLRSFMAFDLFDAVTVLKNSGAAISPEVKFIDELSIETDSLYNKCWVSPKNRFHVYSTTFERQYIIKLDQIIKQYVPGKLYYRFPAIRKGQYIINKDRLNFLSENYSYINTTETSVYKDEYWFDKWYHLNKCGREISTSKLIKELNAQKHNILYK